MYVLPCVYVYVHVIETTHKHHHDYYDFTYHFHMLYYQKQALFKISFYILLHRYRINSHPVEFITDNDVSTYWESNNSSVSVSLGLATVTSLSKIFFDFRDFSPVALRLQYLREPTKVWSDIQFYARDCSTSFGQEETNRYYKTLYEKKI